jgi:hypothetical protein
MPIIRKLTVVGDSRGVTLPHDYLKHCERVNGATIREIAMDIIGNDIHIRPIMDKETLKHDR